MNLNILRVSLIIIIALLLFSIPIASADKISINGSTSSAWQNSSKDNATTTGDNDNNIVIGIPPLSADYFNRENSTSLMYWSNPNSWAEINTSMFKMRLATPTTLNIYQNLSLNAKNYTIGFKYIDIAGTNQIILIGFYLNSYSAPSASPVIQFREDSPYAYTQWTNGTFTSPNWYSNLGIDLKNGTFVLTINGNNVSIYQNGIYLGYLDNWGSSVPTNGTVAVSGEYYPIYFDNFRIWNTTTGNITSWHDFGSGRQGANVMFNFTNSSTTFVDAYASTDNFTTSNVLVVSNITNATWVPIPASAKNQTQYVKAVLKGNTTSTPELIGVSIEDEAVSAGAGSPNVTSWAPIILDQYIEIFGDKIFSVVANQTIDTWNWYLNETNQTNNYDNLSYNFNKTGYYILEVNGTNANGTSNTVQWNNTVKQAPEVNISMVIS